MIVTEGFEQDGPGRLVWLPVGSRFGFDDLVFFSRKDIADFADVAANVDLVLTGPHASAALPRELEPFVDRSLTQRLQFDYSDISTDSLARRWAEIDPRVVYVRNPVSRLIFDQNRAQPDDPEADLRKAFARITDARPGESVSFAGVDAIRPVTFSGKRVLVEPKGNAGYAALVETIVACAERMSWSYVAARDRVIETVYEKKVAALRDLPLGSIDLAAFHSATNLQVQCVHDTMNYTACDDGAVVERRPVSAQLPGLVSLANRGDLRGEARAPAEAGALPVEDALTIPPSGLRSVARALQLGFEVDEARFGAEIRLNTPYQGAWEVQAIGRRLRDMAARAAIRHRSGGGVLHLALGAYQAEYLRETVLGPQAVAQIQRSGTDWPAPDNALIDALAQKLKASQDLLRIWGFSLAS